VPDAGAPNYALVNVEYTSGAGTTVGLPYVEAPSRCGSGGGWYYDVDPSTGAIPSAILVCPSSCSVLGSDPYGQVNIVLGCTTVAR
jgi:hypothetical protein